MLNPLRDFVAFDLETTGLERDTDEIIEIGAVRVRDGAITDRMSRLLKAEKGLSPLVESLTGIGKEILAEARDPKECLEEFMAFADGLPLVAHNSDFDSAFLEHALSKAGMPPLANPVFDSLLIARVAWPTLDSHRLENLVDKLGIPPQKAHRALPDAEQSALLWLKAEKKLAGYAPATLESLGRALSSGPARWRDFFGGTSAPSGSGTDTGTVAGNPEAAPPSAGIGAAGPETAAAAPTGTYAGAAGTGPAGDAAGATAESLFAGGRMAAAFAAAGLEYHTRPRQARMAALAERALRESRFLVAESEPGTGRVLACLVSAALQARAKRRPVFVSVSGRRRLGSIVTSQVPLLRALPGPEIRIEALKPPSNYVSPRKLAGVLAHPETRLSADERLAVLPLITWLESPGDGDIDANMGFNHERNRLLWSKLSSDSYAMEPGGHAHAARARAARAQVVLITHDLFLDDLALDFALLPAYESIIFDEAHRLPELAQARLGREVNFFRLKHILQTIAQSKHDASGLLAELERTEGGPAAEAAGAEAAGAEAAGAEAGSTEDGNPPAAPAGETGTDLQRLRLKVFEPERQLQKFFNKIAKHAAKRRKDGENRVRYADKLVVEFNAGPESVIASLREVEDLLASLARMREDLAADLLRTAEALRAFRSDLEHLAHPTPDGGVFWIEDFPNPHRAIIRSAPVEIGSILAEKFYPQMDAVVFASPAVAIGDDFGFFCRQIGLESAFQDRLKTALVRAGGGSGKRGGDPGAAAEERPDPLFIARFNPVLSSNGALQKAAQWIGAGLRRFPVPSFGLFTHIGMLKQARSLLQESLAGTDRIVLAQHVDGSRDNLLHLFRTRADACLLGTDAFVEGLGGTDMLPEIVMITKLPFPVPTEPLVAPHLERLQEAGRNPLYDHLLPCAILRLKQELNRLPRRPGRKLAIWVLDPRLATEKYARLFQRGLGREAIVCESEEALMAGTAAALGRELPVSGVEASAEPVAAAPAAIAAPAAFVAPDAPDLPAEAPVTAPAEDGA